GGSLQENLRRHDRELLRSMEEFQSLGANEQKGSAINIARETYKKVRAKFGELVGKDALKGVQIHHALEELAENPRAALNAENLIFARGQAKVEGSLHWLLHRINTLAKEGVENPGRQALIEAIDKKLISEKLVSPTLRTPSANAGKLTK